MITKQDVKHIEWIYYRMVFKHKENPNFDYMIKFREILDKLWELEKKAIKESELTVSQVAEKGCGDDYPIIPQ